MSKKVDDRVVEMRFDNKDFESNVKTSMSTLEKLKKALKFDGATKGLENVSSAAGKVNFSPMASAIETVNAKFSAMQVVAMTALSNITSAAMSAGQRLLSSLTIDPILSGFREYETQINSVQTILANTQSKGSTLQDVNRALDELNKYADQTIYNFTEMTRNIGTFTAAGVDLDKSVTSIKGIANLAAVSGSNATQASTVMYQLSQALAAGRVSLMDWNSVVNGGMGGELFQNALKRTAENMGTNVDALIEKYGSFRESLTQGQWLTTDVLTETLTQLSGAYTEADLLAKGYTQSQAQEILQLAETAVNAATKVKTFTQLFDTLGEALQSGWTQSWEIILGDFNEAQEMFTKISETLGDAINSSAEARNAVLMGGLSSGWKQFLNEGINDEEAFIDTVKKVANEHGVAVDKMLEDGTTFEESLKSGWLTSDMLVESVTQYVDSLSKMSAEERMAAGYTGEQVEALQNFAEQLRTNSDLAEEFASKMRMESGRENIIQGVWNAFEGLASVLTTVRDAFREVFPAMTGEQLYDLTVKFRNFTETLKPAPETLEKISRIAKGVFSAFDLIRKGVMTLLSPIGKLFGSEGFGNLGTLLLDAAAGIGDFFTALNESTGTGEFFSTISDMLGSGVQGLSSLISSATAGVRNFGDIFSFVGDTITNVASSIWNALKEVFGWITENVTLGDFFNGLLAGGGILGALKLGDIAKSLKEFFSGGILGMIFGTGDGDKPKESPLSKIGEQVTDVLDSLHDSLQAFTTGIKAATLLEIAGAMWLLGDSLEKISAIDSNSMARGLVGMGAMFTMLNLSFRGLTKSLTKFDSGGIVKAGVTLIAMAYALDKFSDALVKVSGLKTDEIARGLVALGGALGELIVGLKFLDGVKINIRTTGAIVALAYAASMLGDALGKFATYNWDEIGRGLTAMGGALGELVAALAILSKVGGGGSLLGSISILIVVQSLGTMAEGLKSFAEMNWDEIGRGLAAMGGALGELTVALGVLSAVGGFGSILGAVGILIAVQSLDEISENLKKMGSLSWEEIGRGLTAMGVALLEVAGFSGALGTLAGFSGLVGAGSIVLAVQSLEPIANALERLSALSWEEIGRGLVAMGGALAELGAASFLTGLGGLSSLVGGGSILLAVQALDQLSSGFSKFGEMDWGSIGRGLVAMGGALAELGAASFLTGLGGLASLAGGGSLTLASQGLGDLAEAFQKFGSMNWDEIGRGLTAMGAAMGETALGSLLNTFSGFGAGAIAEVAGPLGTLADSVKKWTTITVPEGFGTMLGEIGGGVQAFNFSGWGADAIAAVAEPLGQLSDSVKKWTSVTVPEGLGEQLESLAPGIEAFNFAGWGGDAIATVAEPLGVLADSIAKWTSVTVPEGLGEQLESLAPGIEAFNFSGWGADAISALAEPLGQLADSVGKWSGITVPENMQSSLEGLGTGVKAFNFSGWGAGDMGNVVEPLANLADSVAKWSDITVPENMESTLTSLARGVKAFDLGLFEGVDVGEFIDPLNSLAEVLPKYSGLAIATDIGTSIESLGAGIKSLSGEDPGDLSGIADSMDDVVDAVQTISGVDLAGTAAQLTEFATAVDSINISSDKFASLGTNMVVGFVTSLNAGQVLVTAAATSLANAAVNSFTVAASVGGLKSTAAGLSMIQGLANGMRSGLGTLQSTVMSVITSAVTAITAKNAIFRQGGVGLVAQLAAGIASGRAAVSSAVNSTLVSSASAIRGYYSSFYSAGAYIAQGLANGMSSRLGSIRSAATQMARLAAQATRAAAQVRSPSRVFYKIGGYMGQGLVNALDDYSKTSYKAGKALAESATDGLTKSIGTLGDYLNSSLDVNPTIKPVLDLTNVESGASKINGMLGNITPTKVLGQVDSIDRMMNSRIQNGSFSDVVNAVDRLRGALNNVGNTTYTVNGVTYDDGTNIAVAVGDLTRAIRLERRV